MSGDAVRRLGEGYEPHVDEADGRLLYGLPVDSGFFSAAFEFPITGSDLERLLQDPYRRALLEVIAHTMLQRSMIRGNPPVTEAEFAGIAAQILHSTSDDLAGYVASVAQDHNINIDHFVSEAMRRRNAQPDRRMP